MLILLGVPVAPKLSRTKAHVNKGLALNLPSHGLLLGIQSFKWHRLLLKNLKVDLSVQPLFELEERTLRGMIPSCFLQQVPKMCNILINCLASHNTVCQLPICLLLRSSIGKSLPKVVAGLDSQLFIIGAIHWGYSIAHIAITFHKQSLGFLHYSVIDGLPSHK